MKNSIQFRILVLFASSLMFLCCGCGKELYDPGGSLTPLTLYLENPSPWQTGGVYKITITGTEPCNNAYQATYTTSTTPYDVVPPKKGEFRIHVKFQTTCCTYNHPVDGCPGSCQSSAGIKDGYPIYETSMDYMWSGTTRVGCNIEPTYWQPANIRVNKRTECGC